MMRYPVVAPSAVSPGVVPVPPSSPAPPSPPAPPA
ncbi:energy transducer TonB, partial [Streptomyces griseus]|nr:energy transducer TonB [Streptomyces griseus]